MRADMKAGAEFPDYQLPDHTGTLRRLSELQGEDPLEVGDGGAVVGEADLGSSTSLPTMVVWLSAAMVLLLAAGG
jgi:hypothetical protein